ncbi:uncharacterized protein ARMOST_01580 [Armillaria ostoyae]|uniref:Integral membrane protein n=1 Tax=Armillaria ostoyae TaxID=47428 RepID=A0A284QPC0_ARMOS|nr:uncharacterized protein ARMOST_01580 [Armillaria ostoyae]
MAIQTDIPSDLTDEYKAELFQYLDATLNSGILCVLLHGIYTGILAVTLWNIFINKCWPIRRAMVIVIIFLHALITVGFAANWSRTSSAFIDNGKNFWTVNLQLTSVAQAASLEVSIAASVSTILTDIYMIWCCWMVWGRRWLVVLLPTLSLISATASKIIQLSHYYSNTSTEVFLTLYITFVLGTTLWCTLLIIYRILTVAGVNRGAYGRLRAYQHFIEALVESSALYSISLIVYLALLIRADFGLYYLDVIASIAKGIAPTLIVGRITAGHRARPDDSWQGSVIGSASIRSRSQEHSRTSFREDDRTSPILDRDLEAQRAISLREPFPTRYSASIVADYAHPNTHVAPETLPHLRNCSLLHDRSSPYEDATCGSTVMDEATVSSQ